jgi:cell division protein FtsI (penicillin-binding protein 3)
VVNSPSNGVYFGNVVAGTVFKEISDKVYATRFFRNYIPDNKEDIKPSAPDAGNGYSADINEVLKNIDVRYTNELLMMNGSRQRKVVILSA